jgi:hypothetical protein
MTATPDQDNVTCNGDNDGTASITAVAGGVAPYTYQWSTGSTAASISGLAPGNYNVIIRDANLCEITVPFTITEPAPITYTSNQDNVTCNGDNDGSASITSVAGGVAPYTYLWSTGSTAASISGLAPGNYNVIIRDANLCEITVPFTITEPAVMTATPDQDNVTCNGDNDGTASITAVAGGVAPYTYQWSTGSTAASISGLAPGNYNVIIRDANLCEITVPFTITEPAPITATPDQDNVTCNGDNDGTASITAVAGGVAPYTYQWSTGSTAASISGLAPGNYNVIIRDANLCEITVPFTITEPSPITYTSNQDNVTCNGDNDGSASITAVAGGVAPYTYQWSTGSTATSISGLAPGNYNVIIRDANLCEITVPFTITEPAVMTATPDQDNVTCNGDNDGTASITAVAGGVAPYTYQWSTGSTAASISGLAPGNYNVIIRDANLCEITVPFTITEPAVMTATPDQDNVTCNGDNDGTASITAVAGGVAPYTYQWSTGSTAASISGLAPGNYNVIIRDANLCEITVPFTITEPAVMTATPDQDNVTCNGDNDGTASITAVAGGVAPYTYLWSTGSTAASISGLAPGNYNVIIRDANLCEITVPFTITEPVPITYTSNQDNVTCNGDNDGTASITSVADGVPPYTYQWSTGSTAASISGLAPGNYNVIIRDANLCEITVPFTITEPAPITATPDQDNVTCNGDNDGTASITAVAGGVAPYTYQWSTGSTATSISGLAPGNYNVIIRDANLCEITVPFTITEPAVMTATPDQDNVTCNGDNDGTASITAVAGGVAPYTYQWSTGSTAASISGLAPGNYNVIIRDANLCEITVPFTITQSSPITASASQTNVICNGDNNGTINISAGGGTPGYTYSWNDGVITANRSGLAPGTYRVTILDTNGCALTLPDFIITEPSPIIDGAFVSDVTTCGGNNGSIITNVSGGTAPYSYNWFDGSTGISVSGLIAGVYTLHITDDKSCMRSFSYNISDPVSFTVDDVITDILCNGDATGSIELNISSGIPFTILWSPNGETTPKIENLTAGTYNVSITDAANCTFTDSYTIDEFPALALSAVVGNTSGCSATNGSITLNVTGGNAPYTYLWTDDGSTLKDRSNLSSGSYEVTITDANGCLIDSTFSVNDPAPITIVSNIVPVTCTNGNDGEIHITAITGGTAPYTYLWNDGITTTANRNGLTAGSYVLTVTDATSCSRTFPALIVTEPDSLDITALVDSVSCIGNSDGSISVTVNNGTAPYTYSWSNSASTNVINGLTAGNYHVDISDATGCPAQGFDFNVAQPDSIRITPDVDDITCFGDSDGSINILPVTGGTSPYAYAWSTGASTAGINGLIATNYDVTITDANGCSRNFPFVITEPSAIGITSFVDPASCNGSADGEIRITPVTGGTAPYTYQWSGGSTATNDNITGLTAGSYDLTVTDANGCTANFAFTVTEPAAIVDDPLIVNTTTCGGTDGSINPRLIGGTLPYTYNWSNASNLSILTGLSAGTYTLNVTDANGCAAGPFFYNISDPIPYTVDSTLTHPVCNGGTTGQIELAITPIAAYSISWSPGLQTTPSIAGLAAGIYTVTIKDASNCTFVRNYTITEPTAIVDITPIVTQPTLCGGSDGSITPDISGGTPGYTYAWDIPSTATSVSGLSAGVYTLQVTDANGCPSSPFTYTISDPGFTLTTNVIPVSCSGNNGEIYITSTPGAVPVVTYLWNTGSTASSIINLTPGIYTVDVTDANGCVTPGIFNLPSFTAIDTTNIVDHLTPALCYHNLDGQASFSGITGGPYTYRVDTVTNTVPVFTNLGAGNYTLIISDGGGCNAFHSFTITEPNIITYIPNSTSPVCTDNNGVIEFTNVSGGTTPYFYSIDSGLTFSKTQTIYSGLAPGLYNLVVKDTNQCSVGIPFNLTIKQGPVPYFRIIPPTCNGGDDGAIVIDSLLGGEFPFTFYMNGQDRGSSKVFTDLSSGNYHFRIEDQECLYDIQAYFLYDYTTFDYDTLEDTAFVYVPQPTPITASVLSEDSYNKSSSGVVIVYDIVGGTAPYQYSLDTTAGYTPLTDTLIALTGLDKGYYKVFLKDTNQCTAELTVRIKVGFFIPNLITPNGDGQNDYFEIMALPLRSTLSIYNSWNDRIYYDTNYNNSWEAKEQSDGIYYYELSLPDGKNYKGWLQVLR